MSTEPADYAQALDRINTSGRQPIVFIHGLWLLPSSWRRWEERFESEGYACLAPSWPGDRPTVDQARADSQRPSETLGEIVDRLDSIVRSLDRRPYLIGHSFGGLIAQLLADRELSAGTVAIAPAAFRGVLPLPFSALKSAAPVLHNPGNRHHVVALSFDEFRYSFANALTESEAKSLYQEFAVPAPGGPLFEAAFANLNPWTDDKLDVHEAKRGPLLLVAGTADHVVPEVVVEAEYKLQQRNSDTTEFRLVPDRGHSLVIDAGWPDVADIALAFVKRCSGANQPSAAVATPGMSAT